jgi:hypothetical protein
MDAQAQRAELWTDLASAARALVGQPAVPLVSIAAMLVPTAVPTSGQHSGVVSWVIALGSLALSFVLLGWYGAQRVFFQRHREGKPVTLRHLLRLVIPFAGRFIALGFLCGIVVAVLMFAAAFAFGWSELQAGETPAWLPVTFGVVFVGMDFALTFVTPALAYTTHSAVRALGIGFGMIRQTWPRCALYVLCPPLALSIMSWVFPVSILVAQLALTAVLVVVSLLAKGAIAAFYLRERGSYSDNGAAYITARDEPPGSVPLTMPINHQRLR